MIELLKKIEYALRKDSLTDHERIADARTLVCAAISRAEYRVPAQCAPINDGLAKAMEIVGNMRQSEAGLFDAKHSGQRGCDRADALYDAYVAIKAALSSTECGDGK